METMFPLGTIAITPLAYEALNQANISPEAILQRHVLGDWGDLDDSDKKTNELALDMGGRILSVYEIASDGLAVWVITEPDRTRTTILLPSEQ